MMSKMMIKAQKVTINAQPGRLPSAPMNQSDQKSITHFQKGAFSLLLAANFFISPSFAIENANSIAIEERPGKFTQFIQSRQRANSNLFLGPLRSSRTGLRAALVNLESSSYDDALASLRKASMECVGSDITTASSVNMEYKLGDPCKLRLVVKNALQLVKNPELRSDTEGRLQQIIRNFQLMDDMLDRARDGDLNAAQGVPVLLREAIAANEKLEETVKQCLGLNNA